MVENNNVKPGIAPGSTAKAIFVCFYLSALATYKFRLAGPQFFLPSRTLGEQGINLDTLA